MFLSLEQVIVSVCMVIPSYLIISAIKNCLISSLLMWCSSHLQEKQFPILIKKSISTWTLPFRNLSSYMLVTISLFNLAPVRNTARTYKSWLLFLILQFNYLHQLCISKDINSRLHHILQSNHKDDIYKSYHKSVLHLLFSSSLLRYCQSNGYVFSLGTS